MYLPTHLEWVKGVVASVAGEASEGAPLGPMGAKGRARRKKSLPAKIIMVDSGVPPQVKPRRVI